LWNKSNKLLVWHNAWHGADLGNIVWAINSTSNNLHFTQQSIYLLNKSLKRRKFGAVFITLTTI